MQDLSGSKAVVVGAVCFNSGDGARFPSPSVVDDKLCVFSEKLLEQLFVVDGHPSDIPHGEHPTGFEPLGVTRANPPEIR